MIDKWKNLFIYNIKFDQVRKQENFMIITFYDTLDADIDDRQN